MRQDAPGELWDIYDAAGNKTGRVQRRGEPLQDGDWHLCVHVWVQNSRGEYLLTLRAPGKPAAGLWECTGGSAISGESSLDAALREVREETGLRLDPEKGQLLFRMSKDHYHCDVWRFQQNFDLEDVVLQPGETADARLAPARTIRRLHALGQFFTFDDMERVLDWK